MLSLQNFALALFSISLGAKGLLSTHSLASFVIDLSSFNQVGLFFSLNASNSSLTLILHSWTECCFTQCIVKSHAYPLVYCFQPRPTLCNWASRQSFFFECYRSMLWLPIVEHRVRAFLTYSFKPKDLSKTFLVLVWILIERPYKWRHQFQVYLTVFKARNLRAFHCLWCSEDQTPLRDLWSGVKVKILFSSSKTAGLFLVEL